MKIKVNDRVFADLSNLITITIKKKMEILFVPFHKLTGTLLT